MQRRIKSNQSIVWSTHLVVVAWDHILNFGYVFDCKFATLPKASLFSLWKFWGVLVQWILYRKHTCFDSMRSRVLWCRNLKTTIIDWWWCHRIQYKCILTLSRMRRTQCSPFHRLGSFEEWKWCTPLLRLKFIWTQNRIRLNRTYLVGMVIYASIFHCCTLEDARKFCVINNHLKYHIGHCIVA